MHTTGKRELISTSHPVASPLAVGVGWSGVCGVLAHIAGFEPLWQLVYVSWGYVCTKGSHNRERRYEGIPVNVTRSVFVQ